MLFAVSWAATWPAKLPTRVSTATPISSLITCCARLSAWKWITWQRATMSVWTVTTEPRVCFEVSTQARTSPISCGAFHAAALERLMFPLGEYSKQEVRELAARYDLAVKEKVESQEICFVENDSVEEFIREFNAEERGEAPPPASTLPGPVVDGSGKVVGEHRGSAFYTIGQRKGLGISLGRPAYVVGLISRTTKLRWAGERT